MFLVVEIKKLFELVQRFSNLSRVSNGNFSNKFELVIHRNRVYLRNQNHELFLELETDDSCICNLTFTDFYNILKNLNYDKNRTEKDVFIEIQANKILIEHKSLFCETIFNDNTKDFENKLLTKNQPQLFSLNFGSASFKSKDGKTRLSANEYYNYTEKARYFLRKLGFNESEIVDVIYKRFEYVIE
jgi:hypothetical protein